VAEEPAFEAARTRWPFGTADLVADTATSRVYKVELADGTFAALKLLKPYGADEIEGVRLMQWLDGEGAARILGIDGPAILMEWLDGTTLGISFASIATTTARPPSLAAS
jgi:streptomycin 6-kinase